MRRVKLSLNKLESIIKEAADALRNGAIVVYPTDTVYGMAADIQNESGLRRLLLIKGTKTPMPVVTDTFENAEKIGVFNSNARKLAELFWPGPLTLIVKSRGLLPEPLEHNGKIALRIPDHIFPQRLARELNGFLISTSACPAGMSSPFTPDDAEKILGGKIDLLIDDGPTKYKGPSTIIDTTVNPPKIVRPGVLSPEDIENLSGIILLT
jgi:L-threonylcarbamoyladenylate synthase